MKVVARGENFTFIYFVVTYFPGNIHAIPVRWHFFVLSGDTLCFLSLNKEYIIKCCMQTSLNENSFFFTLL